MVKVAINGLGRIGRLVFRIIEQLRMKGKDIQVVAINDCHNDIEYMSYLLKYDSVHGVDNFDYSIIDDNLYINKNKIICISERDPSKINWSKYNSDYVIESTGIFITQLEASKHLILNPNIRVIVSAPSKDLPMYVMGVNETDYNKESIISNASCTTNCLGPLAKILHNKFNIIEGLMTTIHSTTATQKTVDGVSNKDWRGGRSALTNIIPASTGAAKAVGKIIPSLNGKLTGMAFRVPTIDVSVVDLTVRLDKSTSYDNIIDSIKSEAEEKELQNIIGFSQNPLVSSDFIGDSRSCIIDIKSGIALNDNFFKIIAWYDNEWGYCNRLVDLLLYTNQVR